LRSGGCAGTKAPHLAQKRQGFVQIPVVSSACLEQKLSRVKNDDVSRKELTMSGINLTGAMRSNLLSLNNTQNLINSTQNRLATGLKVSSALDNPQNFFQAQSLNNRASDLSRLQDSMRIGVRTLEAADKGIKAMTKITENMIGLARQARDSSDAETRASLASQFDALRTQLADQAKDSNYNGTNLLLGDELEVIFNTALASADQTSLTINDAGAAVVNLGATGTGALASGEIAEIYLVTGSTAANAWGATNLETGATNIDGSIDALQGFLNDLRTSAATLGTNLSLVQVREEFTKDMINTLKAGADDLTLADENQEAANLLALQTRQQLGIQALSLASQSQQGILRLF
jgi:flagellin